MVQAKTATYYQQKVNEVLLYIDSHLADDLSVKILADKACISPFHFHRIMRAVLGEPLGCYVNKKRLEVALNLIRYTELPLNQIGEKIGYNDISSFSKSFSKQFGIPPQTYRNGHELNINTHVDFWLTNQKIEHKEIKPKLINIPEKQVYFIPVTGRYGGQETYDAWNELIEFVDKNKLMGWRPEFYSIYYDEPEEVGEDNCLTDLCFVSKKMVPLAGRIQTKTFEHGRFAAFRYKGPYEQLWELYNYVYRVWLLTTDLKIADRPIREKYLNYSPQTKPENLLTEIYIPID